jgi:hypothetical protein
MQLTRLAVPVLCAAAIVYACAPRSNAGEPAASMVAASPARDTAPMTRKSRRALADSIAKQPLAASLDVSVAGAREVTFALHVTNRAEKNVELMFPSGQTHDFIVQDANGREVWRWSEGRMFTQALQSKLLSGSETTTYQDAWQPGTRTGRFTVVASLRSTNHEVRQVAEFTLP